MRLSDVSHLGIAQMGYIDSFSTACFVCMLWSAFATLLMASKKLIYALVLFVLVASSGCGHSPPPTVAVVPRTTALMLWEAEHAGAEDSASRNGFRVFWNAPTREDDTEKQIALVERVVSEHVQGLVLAPDQPLALMTPVRRALAQNIPVVVIGSHSLSLLAENCSTSSTMNSRSDTSQPCAWVRFSTGLGLLQS